MTTLTTIEHRTLALGGLFQCCGAAHDLARRGQTDPDVMRIVIDSVFNQNPDSVMDVYGTGPVALRTGLGLLREALSQGLHREITTYVMTLLQLEAKLRKRRDLLDRISTGVADSEDQKRYFGTTHENVLARLADLYVNTVSTLSPRVNVFGQPEHLNDVRNKNAIRALLLAGMRSAVLWRQCGGSRWRLLLERGPIVRRAIALLAAADTAPGNDTDPR